MKLIIILLIILLLAVAAKVVWDTAEVHELHKMRACFDRRAEEVKLEVPEMISGLEEAEDIIDLELEKEFSWLDKMSQKLHHTDSLDASERS